MSVVCCAAANFLKSRRDWLRVQVAPAKEGKGWDIVLRIDGTYLDGGEQSKQELVEFFAGWVRSVKP